MDKKAYKQLLVSLKKCELNYHAHVREFGKLGKSEINFWAEQLFDYNAKNIEKCKTNTLKNLKKLKDDNKKIVGYGSPAKATTTLNYFNIFCATV